MFRIKQAIITLVTLMCNIFSVFNIVLILYWIKIVCLEVMKCNAVQDIKYSVLFRIRGKLEASFVTPVTSAGPTHNTHTFLCLFTIYSH
jgi:hypothetical protein